MTNYEKIRNMSIEEMAKFLYNLTGSNERCQLCAFKTPDCGAYCVKGFLEYLRQETSE